MDQSGGRQKTQTRGVCEPKKLKDLTLDKQKTATPQDHNSTDSKAPGQQGAYHLQLATNWPHP
jgi:hypothetical protein